MRDVFIIGSKGIPARYGGFETFVDKLTYYKKSNDIRYHVACLSNNDKEYEYNGARCFNVNVPNIGSAKAIIYDIKALIESIKYIKKYNIKNAIIYILACRIGPFLAIYKLRLKKLGIKIYINPDGHEWKRNKWNKIIKLYWKISEKLMIKNADLVICDSICIENYIKTEYKNFKSNTTYISYGSDNKKSIINDDDKILLEFYNRFNIKPNNYYLVVGRFVPENNYEIIIREFINSNTKKDLVIITNVNKNKFYKKLLNKTHFDKDNRIKFVGTVYDQELLKKIRENAYAYIHGHEVGGTNPSLLEALASTKINILYNVSFNKEVALDGALYFNKEEGSLKNIIDTVEKYHKIDIYKLKRKAQERILKCYLWEKIVNDYENIFK